jgi:hypothetical protein
LYIYYWFIKYNRLNSIKKTVKQAIAVAKRLSRNRITTCSFRVLAQRAGVCCKLCDVDDKHVTNARAWFVSEVTPFLGCNDILKTLVWHRHTTPSLINKRFCLSDTEFFFTIFLNNWFKYWSSDDKKRGASAVTDSRCCVTAVDSVQSNQMVVVRWVRSLFGIFCFLWAYQLWNVQNI